MDYKTWHYKPVIFLCFHFIVTMTSTILAGIMNKSYRNWRSEFAYLVDSFHSDRFDYRKYFHFKGSTSYLKFCLKLLKFLEHAYLCVIDKSYSHTTSCHQLTVSYNKFCNQDVIHWLMDSTCHQILGNTPIFYKISVEISVGFTCYSPALEIVSLCPFKMNGRMSGFLVPAMKLCTRTHYVHVYH